jgi:hypothetical protein
LEDQTYHGTKTFRTKPICCRKPIGGQTYQLEQNYTWWSKSVHVNRKKLSKTEKNHLRTLKFSFVHQGYLSLKRPWSQGSGLRQNEDEKEYTSFVMCHA